jgi:hypothetical protein
MKAHELLRDERNWARHTSMSRLDPQTPDIVYGQSSSMSVDELRETFCFCMLGAVAFCYSENLAEYHDKLRPLAEEVAKLGYWAIPRFNDDPRTTHAKVVELLKKYDI